MIEVEAITLRMGSFLLRDVSFRVPAEACAVLMGRTGTGKTTLLEAVCGLRRVEAGRILLDGRDVTRLSPAERGIGFVPQDGALFRHLTVRQNLEFALALRRWSRDRIAARIAELAAWLQLEPLLARSTEGLSGGESQRVALGRALAAHPGILCLDEPLSALDDDTRDDICGVLEDLRRRTRVTILHITHNRREAQRLADLLLTLDQGTLTVTQNAHGAGPR